MTFKLSIDIILYDPYSQHDFEKKIESFIIAIEQMGKMRFSGINCIKKIEEGTSVLFSNSCYTFFGTSTKTYVHPLRHYPCIINIR